MAVARIAGAELHYNVIGSGEPLILVSGMGGVASYWAPQLEAFAKHFTVVTFDQRGTGRSTHTKVDSVDMLAADLVSLMDKIGLERAHIVGHSTGGMLAQIVAIDHPLRVDRLVLYGSRASTDAFTERAMGMRREAILHCGMESFVHSTAVFLYPSWWIRRNDDRLRAAEALALANAAPPEVMASRIAAVLHHEQMERLHLIGSPTLVLCACDDFLTPTYYSEEMAAAIPRARLAFIESGGHACSQTNPEAFNRVVLDFLQSEPSPE
ncbi:MAG TPA: alpha/beta hydrolase [Stellaceae bacterium]|nr:alpha/beta hydrolase [Stellaceae bacterium]